MGLIVVCQINSLKTIEEEYLLCHKCRSSLSPCLNIGVIIAFFRSEGILPVSMDELIISEIMPAVWSIVRFPTKGSIPSGPEEREYLVSRARSMISLELVGTIAKEPWTDVVM